MPLLSDEERRNIPPLHSSQETASDPRVYAKLISLIDITWFVLELDTADQDTFLAYVFDATGGIFGYYSLSFLESMAIFAVENLETILKTQTDISGELSVAIVYDKSFTPKLLSEAIAEESSQRIERGRLFKPLLPTEQQKRPYYYAAGYQQEQEARQAYTTIQELIRNSTTASLSGYNLLSFGSKTPWHVVVIGDRPSEEEHQRIMATLRTGIQTTIPFDVLQNMSHRRLEETKKGEWNEHHRMVVLKRKQKKAQKYKRNSRHRGKKGGS